MEGSAQRLRHHPKAESSQPTTRHADASYTENRIVPNTINNTNYWNIGEVTDDVLDDIQRGLLLSGISQWARGGLDRENVR
jgi:hypothetical protein